MPRLIIPLFAALTLALGFSTATLAQDVDCGAITGDEADQILAADPSDPNGLDGDNDGFPCEDNPRSSGAVAPAAPAAAAPAVEAPAAAAPAAPAVVSVPRTGVGAAVGTESSALSVTLLAVAGVLGVTALRTRRYA